MDSIKYKCMACSEQCTGADAGAFACVGAVCSVHCVVCRVQCAACQR